MFDVIVVGGSFAGLSAAMQLVRARRRVLVVDDGLPRNRFAEHSHGFITHDGSSPRQILEAARREFVAYPTAELVSARANDARKEEKGFCVQAGREFWGRRLLLAYGMRDQLPNIPGLAEAWGGGVFHCPFCHGYEVRDQPLAILGNGELALHPAMMLPDWSSDIILFTNGPAAFAADDLQRLHRRGVVIEEAPVSRVISKGHQLESVELADGRRIERTAMLTIPAVQPSADLHLKLGCETEAGPTGPFVKTDPMKETTVPGVFAAGELSRPFGNVPIAVGDGAWAGASLYRSLLQEDWS